MLFFQTEERRTPRQNVSLGATTAIVAGFVNVCSVLTFFAFSSNVTGHVAVLAEEVIKGRWHQVSVVVAWTLMFVFGAFLANLLVVAPRLNRLPWGNAAPVLLQIAALSSVAYYGGEHYRETLQETEYLVGILLFSMGLQNGTVSTITSSVVRTTHLTGLCTDLGIELSMIAQRRFQRDPQLHFRLKLHVVILFSYVLGGLLGGIASSRAGLSALHLASALLAAMLIYDLYVLWSPARRTAPAATTTQAPDRWSRPKPAQWPGLRRRSQPPSSARDSSF